MLDFLQTVRQLKQLTQRELSTVIVSLSIHCDLHIFSQAPQRVQEDSLIDILNNEIFDKSPNDVPTGQIVLQNNLPRNQDITDTRIKKKSEIPKATGTNAT